jgi:pimeloyl-[acyl-carrier protein] methyl ester esterase
VRKDHVIAVVILPGMDGTGIELADFAAALQPELHATVVRYPNDRPVGYAEHELIARASLPSHQPFALLGESYSGPIAISIAESAPPGLIGLVLCCTFARNPRPALSWLRPLVRVLPTRIPAAMANWFLLGRFSTPRLRKALKVAIAQVTPAALRARLIAIIDVDVSPQLARVRVPVLYLRATRDRVVPPSASAEVLRAQPAARVVDLQAPHLLLQTAPVEAAQQLCAFFKRAKNLE